MGLTPERLAEWKRKFDSVLGPGITEHGITVAEGCFLACETLPDSEEQPTSYPYPQEAIVSITQIGPRPRSRPPTARPAEYAAYIFRQAIGDETEAVHEYLETLLGPETSLNRWEVSQRLRRRHKEAREIAQRVTAAYAQRLTPDDLRQNYQYAMSLLEKEKDSLLPGMKQQIVWSASAKMVLFPLMKTGKLDHLEPIVSVVGTRQGGKYTVGSSNCSVSGTTVSFDLKAAAEKPSIWAKILSLPAWYPPWVGEVPFEIQIDGPSPEAPTNPEIQFAPPKKPTPTPKTSKPKARNNAQRKH